MIVCLGVAYFYPHFRRVHRADVELGGTAHFTCDGQGLLHDYTVVNRDYGSIFQPYAAGDTVFTDGGAYCFYVLFRNRIHLPSLILDEAALEVKDTFIVSAPLQDKLGLPCCLRISGERYLLSCEQVVVCYLKRCVVYHVQQL